MSDRTHRWATKPRQKRTRRLNDPRATRQTRLPHAKLTTIKPKDTRYDQGTTGWQVTACLIAAARPGGQPQAPVADVSGGKVTCAAPGWLDTGHRHAGADVGAPSHGLQANHARAADGAKSVESPEFCAGSTDPLSLIACDQLPGNVRAAVPYLDAAVSAQVKPPRRMP